MTRTRCADIASALRIEGDGHVVASGPGRRLPRQAAVLPARAAIKRDIGNDQLGGGGRGLAGDEEVPRVPGVDRDRRPDMLPVTVVTDADVRSDPWYS